MPRKYTADELIAQVRDEARIPDTGSTGNTDADILNRINEFILGYLSGLVMEVKEEYFIRTTRTPLAASTSRYALPDRAMYQKLRDVRYKTGEGYYPLAHASMASLDMGRSSLTATDAPAAFRVEGNHVVLWPEVGTPSGSIDMAFYFSPGELVLQANVAKVEAVSTTANGSGRFEVTLDRALPNSSWVIAARYDIHSPDSGAEIRCWDRAVGQINIIAPAAPILELVVNPDGSVFGEDPVQVGDYVCLTGEAALPGVPRELHPLIGLGAACSVLEDEGDLEVFAAKTASLQRQLFGVPGKSNGAIGLLEDRVEVRPKYITGGRLLDSQGWWA